MTKTNIIAAALLAAMAAVSCGHTSGDGHEHDPVEEKTEKDAHAGHDHDGFIEMTPDQIRVGGVATSIIADSTFSETVTASGRVVAPEGSQGVVSAKVSGIVSFTIPSLAVGTPVKAGQTLFTISAKGLEQSSGRLETATASLEQAERNLKRAEELVKDNLVTRTEYEQAKADYARALAESKGSAVRAAAGSLAASSPVSGFVTALSVKPGQFVQQGEQLATVSQNRRLMLRVALSESQASSLASVSDAVITVPSLGDRTFRLSDYGMRVVSSPASTASSTHYVPVFLEFDNPGLLRDGNVAQVTLRGDSRQGVASVPKEALIEEMGVYYLFTAVKKHPGMFERIPVAIGTSDGERVEILNGLAPGAEVVVRGVGSVRRAENSGALPPGHTH